MLNARKTLVSAAFLLAIVLFSSGAEAAPAATKPARKAAPKAGAAPVVNATPKFKAPAFPLEPGKRPAEEINRDTYVDGRDSPPEPVLPILAPRVDAKVEWQNRMGAGLCYLSTSSESVIAGASQSVQVIRSGVLPICAEGKLIIRPPLWWPAFRLTANYASGTGSLRAEGTGILQHANADARDLRASGEVIAYVWGRQHGESLYELALTGGVGYRSVDVAAYNLTSSALLMDTRKIISAPVGLLLHLSPTPNWFAELSYRKFLWLSSSGRGDVKGQNVSQSVFELEFSRLIGADWSIDLTARYEIQSLHWVMASPEVQDDTYSARSMRFALSLIREL